ncbi:methyltransferase-like protein 13 [Phtheirospermum japonicum]|uniref:Methyltransferase-like protein 13 n=1 Tax=Phtheirospermum japonicum TaxID=374723 RepID=A0A830B6Q4_9LAMI|nr:methyltransferase-like protein 13 [Phtheirospermum japonicum]
MGKKEKQQQKPTKENSDNRRGKKQEELLKTLGDFTSKENWDQFFTIRGSDDSFEWYAEWPQLQSLLTSHLLSQSTPPPESSGAPPSALLAAEVKILVPGCGNSKLSEHLYDAGFTDITNLDFSKVVISDMLRRNVRERPGMKWRVMDMTAMQEAAKLVLHLYKRKRNLFRIFNLEKVLDVIDGTSKFADEAFDVIVDKGGLDALMEPKLGPRLGNLYLSEVKRLLKVGGKYICLTLAESHVLDLLFPKFRFGWKVSLHAIAQEPSSRSVKLQTFMVVAEKDISTVSEISSFMDAFSFQSHGDQARQLYEAIEREKRVRSEYSSGSDILYSLEDLNLGVKGNLTELEPRRRIKLTLGEPGVSRFIYNGVLLDAQPDSGPFSYHFGVFLVPKMRAHEWLFSAEEGQWLIVVSSKAARLVMILLDSSNSNAAMEDIQKDLSPLVKQLAPRDCDDGVPIPFMAASDGIKQREIVHQVTSALTGPIIVDDVIYERIDDDLNRQSLSKELIFRRLTFQRTESLVQSEALLIKEGSNGISSEVENKKVQEVSKTQRKGKQKKSASHTSGSYGEASSGEMKVDHNYLASSYHNGIISGIMLISLHLKRCRSAGGMIQTAVIGLGAGLLPMFMKNRLPSLKIEVVELDPVILDVAREYFGFRKDEHLKVNITDGIQFVREKADSDAVDAEGKGTSKLDLLIVDVDSSDTSSGLTCPAADFVEESFLLTVKDSLSEQGLFIINLVSRSSTVKSAVYSRLKMVFSDLFSLQLEEDVNEVIFALKTDSLIKEDQLAEARNALATSLEAEQQEWSQRILDASKLIKPLR